MSEIGTLTRVVAVSTDPLLFIVACNVCGDVTAEESAGIVTAAPLVQVSMYRQRHLARHLTALAAEINEAVR